MARGKHDEVMDKSVKRSQMVHPMVKPTLLLINAWSCKSLHTVMERSPPHKAMKVLVGFDQAMARYIQLTSAVRINSVKTKLQQYINE